MPKIVDPDQLNQATEIIYDRDLKTIQLLVAGNLTNTSPGSTSGVTEQVVYSFSKEEWLTDPTLNELRFPFNPIFEQKLILVDGWKWADTTTKTLLRDGGFQEIDAAESLGVQSLGGDFNNIADQAYYQQVAGFDATADASVADFNKTGAVNEVIEFRGAGGTPDNSTFFRMLLREQGKIYDEGELVGDQALAAIDFRFYGIPLANSVDNTDGTGAVESDVNIDANVPYTGMVVDYLKGAGFTTAAATTYALDDVVQDGVGRWAFCTTAGTIVTPGGAFASFGGTSVWEAFAGEVQIGTAYYAFNRIIDGNLGTAKEIYEWAARQNRLTTDINNDTLGGPNQNGNGAQFGRISNTMCFFVGADLQSRPGCAITNFDTNATNNIRQNDITVDGGGVDTEGIPVTSTERQYPFVAAGNLVFSTNLTDEADVDTLYKMFFDYSEIFTDTDVAMTAVATNTGTITSTNIDLSVWAANEFMFVSGFTDPALNGMYLVTGTPAVNSIDVTKVDSQTLVLETAGASVSLTTNPFDSPDAIIVNDNSASPITAQITATSIAFDFDYTNNAQGGRTPNTDAPVTVIALGKGGARWTIAKSTLVKATGQNIPVNASDELVYNNP